MEKASGPEHPDVATALEYYAVLLRETGRDAEADTLDARIKIIRAKHASRARNGRLEFPELSGGAREERDRRRHEQPARAFLDRRFLPMLQSKR